jgi:hypothetical protein
MLWCRWLVIDFLLWRPDFGPGCVQLGFILDSLAMGQVFLPILCCSPVTIIPVMLYAHMYISVAWLITRWGGKVDIGIRSFILQRRQI